MLKVSLEETGLITICEISTLHTEDSKVTRRIFLHRLVDVCASLMSVDVCMRVRVRVCNG